MILDVEVIQRIIEKWKDRKRSRHHLRPDLSGVKTKTNHHLWSITKGKLTKIHETQKRKKPIFYYLEEIQTILVCFQFLEPVFNYFYRGWSLGKQGAKSAGPQTRVYWWSVTLGTWHYYRWESITEEKTSSNFMLWFWMSLSSLFLSSYCHNQ